MEIQKQRKKMDTYTALLNRLAKQTPGTVYIYGIDGFATNIRRLSYNALYDDIYIIDLTGMDISVELLEKTLDTIPNHISKLRVVVLVDRELYYERRLSNEFLQYADEYYQDRMNLFPNLDGRVSIRYEILLSLAVLIQGNYKLLKYGKTIEKEQ